ncbi:MAG: zf-HC2 domain-containing protein [candidate division Zixibacteria bacterium]|nr:zf-HC2 domain-containing protein [candidate division Zixibacteria bacterium]
MAIEHITDDRFQEYLDGNLTGDALVLFETHLDMCEKCRENLRQYHMLYERLGDDTGFTLPADFAENVVSLIEQESPETSSSRLWSAIPGFAFIAAIIGTLMYFFGIPNHSRIDSSIYPVINSIIATTVTPIREALVKLNINPQLFLASVLVLLSISVLDYLFRHARRRPSSMCL